MTEREHGIISKGVPGDTTEKLTAVCVGNLNINIKAE